MSSVEIAEKARAYKELQCFIKQLEEEAEAIKASITTEMEARGTNTLQADIFTVKYTEYQSQRLDSAKLKSDHADLYAAYTKTTTGRRFQIA